MQETTPLITKAALTLASGVWFDVYIITILYVFRIVEKKDKRIKMAVYIILGSVFLCILNVVANVRNSNVGFLELFSHPELFVSNNFIFDSIAEYGVTSVTLCYSLVFFSLEGKVGYGLSYIFSLLTILPGIHDFFPQIQNYIVYVYNIPYPYKVALGGSYIGEIFFNFRNYGIPLFFLIGVLIAFVSNKIHESIKTKDYFTAIIFIPLFPFLLIWVRGYFRDLVRTFIWQFVLIEIIKYFIISRNYEKMNNQEADER